MPPQVTARLHYRPNDPALQLNARPTSRNSVRAPSPTKSAPLSVASAAVIKPKAKVNTSSIARTPKAYSVVSPTSSSSKHDASSALGRLDVKSPVGAQGRAHSPVVRSAVSTTSRSLKSVRSNIVSKPTKAGTNSVPSTPVMPTPMLATNSDSLSSIGRGRARTDSISLQRAISISSLQHARSSSVTPVRPLDPSPSLSNSPQVDSGGGGSVGGGGFKIRAKLTSMAKVTPDSLSPPLPNSLPPSTESRARAPSMSSSASFPEQYHPQPQLPTYPITTPTPAANPHRFATARVNHLQQSNHHYQPFYPDHHINVKKRPSSRRSSMNIHEVDPATIPLPPLSPPTSTLSFSSRSSVSQSSASRPGTSVDEDSSASGLGAKLRSKSRDRPASGDSALGRDTDEELNGVEHRFRAEAKTNRKIADLEITNRSLLAINANLESTKHRQAKEIRELRRKLRESRLILPPRTYRAVKSSLDHDDEADDEDDEEEDDEEEDTDDVDAGGDAGDGDETYRRVKLLLDSLTQAGKRALETKPEDFMENTKGGTKVLSVEEQRNWRGELDDNDHNGNRGMNGNTNAKEDDDDDEDEDMTRRIPLPPQQQRNLSQRPPLSPSLRSIPNSDTNDSEDEVEALTLGRRSMTSSPIPPIHITESP